MKWDLSYFYAARDAEDSTSPGEIADIDSKDLRDELPPIESTAASVPGNQVSRGCE
jgi:hypothetical protein